MIDAALEIFRQSTVSAYPGKEPLDHLSAREHGEANLIGDFMHNFDNNMRGFDHPLVIVAAICKNARDERKQRTRGPQEKLAAIAVLSSSALEEAFDRAPFLVGDIALVT
jgi:hypothetical protein